MQKKKVLAVIPARYDSSRFPGKLLTLLDGESVIHRVVSKVIKCKNIDDVVLATDDDRIASAVAVHDIDIVFARDFFRNGTERVASISSNYPKHDVIINIQGDEPLLNPAGLDELIELLKGDSAIKIASLMSEIFCQDSSEHVVKIYVDEDDFAIRFTRELPADIDCYSHIGVYGFQRETLLEVVQLPVTMSEKENRLEQLRWLDNGYRIKMIPIDQNAISIDVPSDIAKAELLLKSSQLEGE